MPDPATLHDAVAGDGHKALGKDGRPEQLTQRGHLGARRHVADPLLVGEHREVDPHPAYVQP